MGADYLNERKFIMSKYDEFTLDLRKSSGTSSSSPASATLGEVCMTTMTLCVYVTENVCPSMITCNTCESCQSCQTCDSGCAGTCGICNPTTAGVLCSGGSVR